MKKYGIAISVLFLMIFVFSTIVVPAAEEIKLSTKATKLMKKAFDAIKKTEKESDALKKTQLKEKAFEYFKEVIALEPSYSMAYHFLGALYVEKGMFDEAISNFETAWQLKSDNPDELLALRETLFEAGQDATSKKNYEKANGYLLKLDNLARPEGERKSILPYAQYLLGFNFFNLKQYQQANDYFSKCQKNEGLEKDNLSLYGNATYFLGMVNHILGQYDVSIDYFQKYLTVYTGSALQPEFLAQANYFMGANLFRQLEEKMTKGDVSKMSESAQAILPYLNKAVEMKILIEDAYVMLGNCYVYIKNYDQAIKTYQQLCEFFPQSLQLKNYQDFLQELQRIQQQEQKPKKKR